MMWRSTCPRAIGLGHDVEIDMSQSNWSRTCCRARHVLEQLVQDMLQRQTCSRAIGLGLAVGIDMSQSNWSRTCLRAKLVLEQLVQDMHIIIRGPPTYSLAYVSPNRQMHQEYFNHSLVCLSRTVLLSRAMQSLIYMSKCFNQIVSQSLHRWT